MRVRRPYDCLPTHAGSHGGGRGWAGENELLWQGERRETWIGGGYIATTIYSLYLGSFCNEMACVMEALSKQWAYSAQRAVSVGTGLNTIPLIQGCGHSFLSILVFYTLLTVEITSSHLSLCLPAEKKVCNRVVQRPRDKKKCSHVHVWKDIIVTVYLYVNITCVARRPIFRLYLFYYVIGFRCFKCC